jgi:uncharacterized membrane protein YgcG
MRSRIATFAVFVLLSAAVAGAELRAGSAIEDGGHFFSPAAIAEGNRIIEEIHRETRPPKDVAVVTVTKLGSGVGSPRELAEHLFRERSMDGLLVFAVKEPGRLEVVVGRHTAERFPVADRDEMVPVMLDRFKKKEFDEGLLAGLRFAREKLVAAFPAAGERVAARGAPHGELVDQRGGGLPAWAWILILLAGVWVVMAIVRASRQPQVPGAPPAGGAYPPSYGYGGGGFGRSLLGGLFGAMAGQWLYDRMTGRDETLAYGGRDDDALRGDSRSDWNDRGDVGGSSGGDFGDSSDSDDSGGGDFGGNDSGGGDF